MPIRTLAAAISRYGHDAYLLPVAQDGPHISHVTIELRGSSIGCAVGASAQEHRAPTQPVVVLAAHGAPVAMP
jgi:hypothetical protein